VEKERVFEISLTYRSNAPKYKRLTAEERPEPPIKTLECVEGVAPTFSPRREGRKVGNG
jgi:hypothetical protein